VRLLVDELYTPEIAGQLSELGHDVVAVKQDLALEGLEDDELIAWCCDERRAIVTENFVHFRPLQLEAINEGRTHYGLVCVSGRRFPRSSAGIGRLVRALDHFLKEHPDDDALVEQGEHWLQEAPGD
jgi:hypothetical protein